MPLINVTGFGELNVPDAFLTWDKTAQNSYLKQNLENDEVKAKTQVNGLLENAGEGGGAEGIAETAGDALKDVGGALADILISGGPSGSLITGGPNPITKGEEAGSEWDVPWEAVSTLIDRVWRGVKGIVSGAGEFATDTLVGATDGAMDLLGVKDKFPNAPEEWGVKSGEMIPAERTKEIEDRWFPDTWAAANKIKKKDDGYIYDEPSFVSDVAEWYAEIYTIIGAPSKVYKGTRSFANMLQKAAKGEIKNKKDLEDFMFDGFYEKMKKKYNKNNKERKKDNKQEVFEPTGTNLARSNKLTRGVAKTRDLVNKSVKKLGPTAQQVQLRIQSAVKDAVSAKGKDLAIGSLTPISMAGGVIAEYIAAQKIANNIIKDWGGDNGMSDEERQVTSKWYAANAVFTGVNVRGLELLFGPTSGFFHQIKRIIQAESGSFILTIAGIPDADKAILIDQTQKFLKSAVRKALEMGGVELVDREKAYEFLGESSESSNSTDDGDDGAVVNRNVGGLLGSPRHSRNTRAQRRRGLLG